MDLRRLRYFVTVADELHFGRAARRLRVAQPAVSQQIRALENELGVVLFDRGRHRVTLTEAGRVLLEDGERLLADAARAATRVRAAAAGSIGVLRVAYTRSAPDWPATAVVAEFRSRFPDVGLELGTGYTGLSVAQLREGRLDAAFVRPPLYADDLACTVLAEEEVVVAVHADHPAAGAGRIDVAQLARGPLISWPRAQGPGLYDRIHQAVYGASPVPEGLRIEPDEEQMLRAVADGAGLAPLTRTKAETLRVPGTVVVPVAPRPVTVELGLAHRADDDRPAVARFVEVALAVSARPVG